MHHKAIAIALGLIVPPAFQSVISRHFHAPDENHTAVELLGGRYSILCKNDFGWQVKYPYLVLLIDFFY